VLEARCGTRLGAQDVYLNVAGGLKLGDPAADLAAAAALLSSFTGRPAPEDTVYFGEVSLTGAVRAVGHVDQRLKEATKLGLTRAVVPASCAPDRRPQEIRLMPLSELSELVAWFGLPERD
jgi:DNA repair protein RadA/Sms